MRKKNKKCFQRWMLLLLDKEAGYSVKASHTVPSYDKDENWEVVVGLEGL